MNIPFGFIFVLLTLFVTNASAGGVYSFGPVNQRSPSLTPRADDISGELVSLKDSPIKSLNDLVGKTVGFASPQAFLAIRSQWIS